MGKDPFSKNNDNSEEDFIDFDNLDSGGSSGGGGGNKSRMILALLLVAVVAGAGMFLYFESETDMSMPIAQPRTVNPPPQPVPPPVQPATPNLDEEVSDSIEELNRSIDQVEDDYKLSDRTPDMEQNVESAPMEETYSESTSIAEGYGYSSSSSSPDSPVLSNPVNGARWDYNENSRRPYFTWTNSKNSTLWISRNPDMSQPYMKQNVRGMKFEVPRLMTGVWYWQVSNSVGKSEIRTLTVNAPIQRELMISTPTEGGTLNMNDGLVMWRGDRYVTYYRVELTGKGWSNPDYRFSTSGTQMRIKNVLQGDYEIRVGGFSEVSGKWEYTRPIKITVQ